MLKKIISAAVTICFAAMLVCVNAPVADAHEIQRGTGKLEWGMTLEETEAAMGVPYDKIEEVETSEEHQTLLTYENTSFKGFECYLILCVTEENGYEAENYHIPTDDADKLYYDFKEQLRSECTEYTETGDELSFWHFDGEGENYTVFLFNLGNEVQFSYFPLFAEAERGDTQQGENQGREYTCYGNTNAEVVELLSALRWGMTVDEAIEAIGVKPDATKRCIEKNGWCTYLYYNEVPFENQQAYLLLGFVDDTGLLGVNFYIASENTAELYNTYHNELKSDCTEYESTLYGMFYYFDSENYDIRLCDLSTELQFSYFPPTELSERGDTIKGGNMGYTDIHEPSPETGNTAAAVYAGIMLIAGSVMLLTRRRREAV